ncbi:MAG: hypothetical protein DLM69_03460 [Candidatus Chloroheliales bacterium]|nr:MAG: hypothetical protein DLM69_03460 [Chloroflexota bacterium]
MWSSKLVACARAYASAVLTVVETSGYPGSVRCQVEFDDSRELITFTPVPAAAAGWSGKACLLFHRHDEHLGNQHEMMIKGELLAEGANLIFRPVAFLTGTGRQDSDRMPVAGSMLDIIRFMLLGRRKAREYIAKRGRPWPPRPWDKMLRYLDEP